MVIEKVSERNGSTPAEVECYHSIPFYKHVNPPGLIKIMNMRLMATINVLLN